MGGQDQRCVVQVKLDRLPKVVTEETQVDLGVAVDRALIRAGRASVTRRLRRARGIPAVRPLRASRKRGAAEAAVFQSGIKSGTQLRDAPG
ncbi:MAG: hypothetical protein MZW92_80365 [Comamonadaceae bacterium]|nr:hypothetical protein [Comamonadaceae bacterium]